MTSNRVRTHITYHFLSTSCVARISWYFEMNRTAQIMLSKNLEETKQCSYMECFEAIPDEDMVSGAACYIGYVVEDSTNGHRPRSEISRRSVVIPNML
jgi:hypothetical protein